MELKGIRKLQEFRYFLLAGTLMSALAIPHWAVAFGGTADGRIIVAQVDPKDKNKGKAPPPQKGPPPSAQPKAPPSAQPKAPPSAQPVQPKQIQQGGSGQQKQFQQGGGGQQKQFQQGGGGQPKQVQQGGGGGGQPTGQQGGQPKQFQQGGGKGGGQQGGQGQPKQFQQGGGQGGQPTGVGQQGGQGQPKQFQQGGGQGGGQPTGVGQQGGQGQQKQFQQGGGQGGGQPTGVGQQGGQGQQKQFQQGGGQGGQPTGVGQQGGQGQQKQFQQGGGQGGGQPTGVGQQGGQGQQKQFGKQGPGGVPQGQIQQQGNIEQLRSQRQTSTDQGGRTIIQEGNRVIVRDGGRTIIRSDENARFQRLGGGGGRVEQRGADTHTIIRRPGGVEIINVTDRNGNLIRRIRRGPDRREFVLIENRRGPGFGTGLAVGIAAGVAAGYFLTLAPPIINIPRERYIVDIDSAPPALLYETLEAPPLMAIERPYSLDEVRYNVELRDRMRRIDINTITFDTGSWVVSPDQFDQLRSVAEAIRRVIEGQPNEIFMVEGYTDAVGNAEDNLSLSDRRAESVATILSENFGIPPENLVTQGYGEQFLKVQTPEANRLNRRVAVRRIGPLLGAAQQQQQ